MRCREAKRFLTALSEGLLAADDQKALQEHLKKCPSCGRLALAGQVLTNDMEHIRAVPVPHPMTIQQISEVIASRDKNYKETSLGVRIMRHVNETIYARPRLSLAAAALMVLLVASVLVPVRTDQSAGYEVAFAAPGSGLVLNTLSAQKMLAALDIGDADIDAHETDSGVEYTIAPLKDSVQVRKLIVALDSLGGQQVQTTLISIKAHNRTIWQLLLNADVQKAGLSPNAVHVEAQDLASTINLKERFKGDFVLWMPVGDQTEDSLHGLLMDRQGEKTNIQIFGEKGGIRTDECGWDQNLKNSLVNQQTPDGKWASFKLHEIEDVRRLEKMGYNFATMQWDTPRQVPIPGMGPQLIGIKSNPLTRETVIEYKVPQAYEVQVRILDEHGRRVRDLIQGCFPLGGMHLITWDGLDADGDQVRPGMYQCRFSAGDYVETKEFELR